MSKIRQAVRYERELAEVQLKAEKDLRELAVAYERKYTDGQFGQLQLVAEEHRLFHEREHLLYEDAIEKASTSLKASLDALQIDMDRFRDDASKWMTIERFEREHATLSEKTALAIDNLKTAVSNEEKTTVRQTAQQEVIDRISQNNRWLIGVALTSGISLVALIAHLFRLY